ncbi:MAG: phosphohydrolase [Prosthecochloris sp.]|nr:phosphohydrolase [Prosthecochloris sp.]
MTVNTTLLERSSAYVTQCFEAYEQQTKAVYHDIVHTRETVEAGENIATGMNLPEESIVLVMLSCWFHDIGHIYSETEHETKSAVLAEAFLTDQGVDTETIEAVKECILATRIPQAPQNLMQQIVCDADLSHLGSKNYKHKNTLLRNEFEHNRGTPFSDLEWIEINIGFFSGHSFFTPYAQTLFNNQKEENLDALKDEMNKVILRQKKKAKRKKENDKNKTGADRGVERNMEVYYRTSSRNHVSFSAIVDQKANIMIQTNSLIFSIIISLLVRKLDQLPDLIIPTFLMLLTCVATIITSVLATRPNVTRHETTTEDIRNKKANLLFFGSFVNLDLDSYEWGVGEMLKDKPYYIKNMIRDTYFLGKVLDRKYKFLRLSYDIFMVGLVLSISLYTYAFMN